MTEEISRPPSSLDKPPIGSGEPPAEFKVRYYIYLVLFVLIDIVLVYALLFDLKSMLDARYSFDVGKKRHTIYKTYKTLIGIIKEEKQDNATAHNSLLQSINSFESDLHNTKSADRPDMLKTKFSDIKNVFLKYEGDSHIWVQLETVLDEAYTKVFEPDFFTIQISDTPTYKETGTFREYYSYWTPQIKWGKLRSLYMEWDPYRLTLVFVACMGLLAGCLNMTFRICYYIQSYPAGNGQSGFSAGDRKAAPGRDLVVLPITSLLLGFCVFYFFSEGIFRVVLSIDLLKVEFSYYMLGALSLIISFNPKVFFEKILQTGSGYIKTLIENITDDTSHKGTGQPTSGQK